MCRQGRRRLVARWLLRRGSAERSAHGFCDTADFCSFRPGLGPFPLMRRLCRAASHDLRRWARPRAARYYATTRVGLPIAVLLPTPGVCLPVFFRPFPLVLGTSRWAYVCDQRPSCICSCLGIARCVQPPVGRPPRQPTARQHSDSIPTPFATREHSQSNNIPTAL